MFKEGSRSSLFVFIMLILIYIFLFIEGTVIGSFLNMLAYRIHKGERFIFGRSYNDYTGEELKAIDLIPVISFIIFKGKDRSSGKKLPLSYPLIELLTGVVCTTMFWFLITNYEIETYIFLITNFFYLTLFFFSLLFFALYDFYYWSLNKITVTLGIVYVVLGVFVSRWTELIFVTTIQDHLLGAAVAGGIIGAVVILVKKSGLTFEDVMLMTMVGLFLGLEKMEIALIIIFSSGALVGLIFSVRKRSFKKQLVQFAPFVFFGTIVTFLFYEEITKIFGL